MPGQESRGPYRVARVSTSKGRSGKMVRVTRLVDDLVLIDTNYMETPEAIGVYLLRGDQPALIETGPASTIETLLDGVSAADVDPQDLQALAVTHIHLDHAGAAGMLVRRFPHLRVYVHPVGAPHLIDPSRLLASAARLYGDDLHRLFGDVVPIASKQVHVLKDGDIVTLGSRRIAAIDTPGHARHHHAYWDASSGDLFAGDVAGVALPGSRYVRAPTPPPDLDVPAWHKSLTRLRTLHPRRLLLTHFGPHEWVDELLRQLDGRLDRVTEIVRDALSAGQDEDAIIKRLTAVALREIEMLDEPRHRGRYDVIMPIRQSVQGLIRYVRSHPARTQKASES